MCGCARIAASASKTPEAATAERAGADAARARWRCGERGKRLPLEPKERALCEGFERQMGLSPGSCPGCPFEGLYAPADGWVDELLTARSLVEHEHLPWPEALGRELAAVDVDALAVWRRALARIDRMEREKS